MSLTNGIKLFPCPVLFTFPHMYSSYSLRGTRQRVFERLERLHQAEDTSAVLERLMSCGCMGSHAAIGPIFRLLAAFFYSILTNQCLGAETSRRSGHTRAEGSVNTSTVRRFDCDFCSTVKDIRQYEGALYMDQAKDKMASRRGFADENADEQRGRHVVLIFGVPT